MVPHLLSALLNHSDQNLPTHDEGGLVESAVAIRLILANLSFEVRLHEEVGIELGHRRDNQVSEQYSLPARMHHPAKGVFVLGA